MSSRKKKAKRPKNIRKKNIKVGKWNVSLKNSDVNQIWTELHRIVSSHPLVRASKQAGFLVEEGKYNVYTDMTQELFVALLSKERFQHYIDTKMTDAEIEGEISQIELTNLLTAQLRKRHPESYRLARRISTLIQTSKVFKRIITFAFLVVGGHKILFMSVQRDLIEQLHFGNKFYGFPVRLLIVSYHL